MVDLPLPEYGRNEDWGSPKIRWWNPSREGNFFGGTKRLRNENYKSHKGPKCMIFWSSNQVFSENTPTNPLVHHRVPWLNLEFWVYLMLRHTHLQPANSVGWWSPNPNNPNTAPPEVAIYTGQVKNASGPGGINWRSQIKPRDLGNYLGKLGLFDIFRKYPTLIVDICWYICRKDILVIKHGLLEYPPS